MQRGQTCCKVNVFCYMSIRKPVLVCLIYKQDNMSGDIGDSTESHRCQDICEGIGLG